MTEQKPDTPGAGEAQEAEPETLPFKSSLREGKDRFLSEIVEEGLRSGVVSADSFVRHFPPSRIMKAFEDSADRRADFVHGVSKTARKIALRMGADASGEVIQIALEEGVATTSELVGIFLPDERVERLDAKELWNFCTEWEPWNKKKDEQGYADAQRYTAFILEHALTEGLILPPNVTEALTLNAVGDDLVPIHLVKDVLKAAIAKGREGAPFTDDDLIGFVSPEQIVQFIDIGVVWDKLVRPDIAEAHDFVEKPPPEDKTGGEGDASTEEAHQEPDTATADDDWSRVSAEIMGEVDKASKEGSSDPKADEASAVAADAAEPEDAHEDVHERKTTALPPPPVPFEADDDAPRVDVDRSSIIEVSIEELVDEDIDISDAGDERHENYIPDSDFAKVGGSPARPDAPERTMVPDESKIKQHVVVLLKGAQLSVPDDTDDMPIKTLFIRVLQGLDAGSYSALDESADVRTKDLANMLCRELMNRKQEQLSDQLREALYTILGVDPTHPSMFPPGTAPARMTGGKHKKKHRR